MLRLITAVLLVLIIFVPAGFAADLSVPSLDAKEIVQLNELGVYIDNGAREEDLAGPARDSSYPARAMAAALLFRLDQKKYHDAFFKEFSMKDYEARSREKHDLTSKDDILKVVAKIEYRYPQIADKRILLLLMFAAYRDENIWIATGKGDVSVARFYRTAFLTAVFKDTKLDAAAISDSLDKKAQ